MSDIKAILSTSWHMIKEAYIYETINSERALQSILYCSLYHALPNHHHVIFVEPNIHGFIPDLMILNRKDMIVDCILEIKCSPHWWHTENSISHDLDKLQYFSKLSGSEIELDVFGPLRKLDPNTGGWIGGKPKYLISNETIFGFVMLARKNDIHERDKLNHPISKLQQFLLLTGITDPDTEIIFTIQ